MMPPEYVMCFVPCLSRDAFMELSAVFGDEESIYKFHELELRMRR